MQYRTIALTQDTDDPVIRVEKGESRATFILDTEDKCINVWSVKSAEKGDMKAMLDDIISQLPVSKVIFIAPLTSEEKEIYKQVAEQETGISLPDEQRDVDIEDVLEGFEKKTIEYRDQEIEILEGNWTVDD